jgi:3-methylcrotonyl-CoA carboxylase alpha subunit
LGQHVNYRALGTVEFLVTGDDFYFLEVNPRLQVEHPVTEAVTGLDLVALQIQAARGVALELAQADVPCQGHAIEVRVYAEDAQANFMPSTGVLHHLALPHECARVETGIETGSVITPHYDPMVAKLIVQGDDRQQAIARMRQALSRTRIVGVANNLDFADALFQASEVVTEVPTTATIDTLLASLVTPQPAWVRQVGALAAAYVFQQSRSDSAQAASSQWRGLTHWRLGATQAYVPSYPQYEVQVDAIVLEATVAYLVCRNGLFDIKIGDRNHTVGTGHIRSRSTVPGDAGRPGLFLMAGQRRRRQGVGVGWPPDLQRKRAATAAARQSYRRADRRRCDSPLTGKVLELRVAKGDSVEAGQVLLVLESMKMELRIAPHRWRAW